MNRRRSYSQMFPVLVLVVAIAIAGSYLYRNSLKQQLLTLVSDRLELSNLDFSGLSLDADGMQLEEIRFSRNDDQISQNLTLLGIKLGFSVFPLDLSELRVTRGTLNVDLHGETSITTESPSSRNTGATGVKAGDEPHADGDTRTSVVVTDDNGPLLPTLLTDLSYARIDQLMATVKFPDVDEPIRFDGTASWRSDGREIRIELENDNENFAITSDKDLDKVALTVQSLPQDRNTTPTTLVIDAPLTLKPAFSISTNITALDTWLRRSSVLPEELRDVISEIQESMQPISIANASFDASGHFDRQATWPLQTTNLKVDWQQLRRGHCQIDGAISGTWNSISPKVGSVTIDESVTIRGQNCIDQTDDKPIPSRLQLTAKPGFSVSYDVSNVENPRIDINGPIAAELERERLTLNVQTDDLQLKDAWNEDGLPGTTTTTVAVDASYREFLQRTEESALSADNLSLKGTFSIVQSSQGSPYQLNGTNLEYRLWGLDYRTVGTELTAENVNGTGQANASVRLLSADQSSTSQLQGAIDLSLTTAPTKINLRNSAFPGNLHLDDVRLTSASRARLEAGDSAIKSVDVTLDYQTNAIMLDDPEFGADALTGQASINWNDNLGLSTTLSITNLYAGAAFPPLSIDQVNGSIELSDDRVLGNGVIRLAPDLEIPWDVASGDGGYVINSKMNTDVPVLVDWLRPALGPIADSFSLNTGRGSLTSKIVMTENDTNMTATASLSNLAGSYEELKFSEAVVHVEAVDLLARKLDLAVEVPDGELANGTGFSNLSTVIGLNGDQFDIDQFAIRTFDADFMFESLSFGKKDVTPGSVIRVEGLDLGTATNELGQQQLQATGTMSGQIPFRITDNGVAIDEGHLESDGQGLISYSNSSGQTIEGLNNIALQALENFQYESVILDLGYSENGEYLAKFKLSGNNPDLYDGYPVVLNLNINGQLPGLLRSTLIGGNFNEEILRTLPNQQRPQEQQLPEQQ